MRYSISASKKLVYWDFLTCQSMVAYTFRFLPIWVYER